jgi:hypothetical protein
MHISIKPHGSAAGSRMIGIAAGNRAPRDTLTSLRIPRVPAARQFNYTLTAWHQEARGANRSEPERAGHLSPITNPAARERS